MLDWWSFLFSCNFQIFASSASKLYIICNWNLLDFPHLQNISSFWQLERVEMFYLSLLGLWSDILMICPYSTGDEKESIKIHSCEGVCSRSWVSWSLPILHLAKCHMQVRFFLKGFWRIEVFFRFLSFGLIILMEIYTTRSCLLLHCHSNPSNICSRY